MIEENLKKLGFSPNEIKIYLVILRLSKARAGELIRETSLQRSVVYNGLEELLKRELITKTQVRGVAVYASNDPEALVYEAEQRTQLAKKLAEDLKERQGIKNREVLVYEGEDIVRRVSDKNLEVESGSTIYFLGPSKFGVQANLERYWKKYHHKRAEKGILCKILYDKHTDPEILADRNKLPLCQAKYLPIETEIPMWFSISEDTVGMVIPSEEPPLAFLIKSQKTAEALIKYFEYLWSQSK